MPRTSQCRAFSRADLLASLAAGAIILVLVLGVGRDDSDQTDSFMPRLMADYGVERCAANLRAISEGVAMCFAENNHYGPTADDGAVVSNMLNWTDMLYDLDYTAADALRLCPVDEHPDYVPEQRAAAWGFHFYDDFEHGSPRTGIRTSYALNSMFRRNFKADRYHDAARQIYAMDGWWTWMGSVNAQWLMGKLHLGIHADPLSTPNWQGTMAAWRHGGAYSANVLFADGHVGLITPRVPHNVIELRELTVDTEQVFTWLPGEKTYRFDSDAYRGTRPEFLNRVPAWVNSPYKLVEGARMPVDYPEHLSCDWRTANRAWKKFPNDR